MENSQPDPTKPNQEDEQVLDLYNIPRQSGWFLWDEIHETEKLALKEFFDASSITRTPKIYKEYRDFIINKYREEPSRRLTFTEVRKSLVGDVDTLHKVFIFLENSGLINFSAPISGDNVGEDGQSTRVRIEEGVPNGIRVGATPNSAKPISALLREVDSAVVVESGLKLPPLASCSDVFSDLMKQKKLTCRICGEHCGSQYYEYIKGDFVICVKCFKNGNYGEQKSMDDFELNECIENSGNREALWTEAETLLLLESVLKHGDDWELVAQNVQSKTKLDCILRLIELPFGELMLRSIYQKDNSDGPCSQINSAKEIQLSSSKQETVRTEDHLHEHTNQNGDAAIQGPPKRQRINSVLEASNSLMKQVALISTRVGPDVVAAAADAAVTAICDENLCPRDMFENPDDCLINSMCSLTTDYERERDARVEDSDMQGGLTQSGSDEKCKNKDDVPFILRIRAAIATALGAAGAHAKMLADQEEREIEDLVATIIETQMKKLNCKIKHFEGLELIMDKEFTETEELEDLLLTEWIEVLQTAFNLGISRLRDHSSIRS